MRADERSGSRRRDRRLATKLAQAAMLGLVAYLVTRRSRTEPYGIEAAAVQTFNPADTFTLPPRPERPWLMGEGRWLPVALAGVLVVGLLAAILPERPASAPPPPPEPPPLHAAPAVRGLPPGAAPPIAADEAEWITPDDYPLDAVRAEETGRVRIRWLIGSDGEVAECGVVRSSGHARLDHAACDAITRHANYRPARDAAGWPIAITRERTVRWELPK